jgi:hypothetical protein
MRHGLKKVDDMLMPLLIKNLDVVKTINVRADDTFVIGYPKSGKRFTLGISNRIYGI